MDKRKYRDIIRLIGVIMFSWLYLPHLIIYIVGGGKKLIQSDLVKWQDICSIRLPFAILLLYFLHTNRFFRTLFYRRIGPASALLISWWRPGDRYFNISYTTKIGKGFMAAHPYCTIINADSIGDNFKCLHLTTLGATDKGRPVVGNNVRLGANVTIIGAVHIGNNVHVGAGSIVVKDVPDNCVVAGNPAKIIRYY